MPVAERDARELSEDEAGQVEAVARRLHAIEAALWISDAVSRQNRATPAREIIG